jgi:uncharacterized membrane protein required for colicin V production
MKNIISSLNTLDFILIGLMALGLIVGAKKGLSSMFTKSLSLLGMILLVLHYYSPAADWISANSPLPKRTAEVLVFILIGIGSWLVLDIVFKILNKVIEVKFSETLSRLGGFILGAGWTYCFAGFVLYAFLAFKAPFLEPTLVSTSYLAPAAVKISLETYQFVFREEPPEPFI